MYAARMGSCMRSEEREKNRGENPRRGKGIENATSTREGLSKEGEERERGGKKTKGVSEAGDIRSILVTTRDERAWRLFSETTLWRLLPTMRRLS